MHVVELLHEYYKNLLMTQSYDFKCVVVILLYPLFEWDKIYLGHKVSQFLVPGQKAKGKIKKG